MELRPSVFDQLGCKPGLLSLGRLDCVTRLGLRRLADELRRELAREEVLRLPVLGPLGQPRAPDKRLGGDLPRGAQLVEPDGRDWACLPSTNRVEPVALRLD